MMKDKLKALFALRGVQQKDFAESKEVSRQQLSNKISNGVFKLSELIELGEFTRTKLAFVDENDNVIVKFDRDDLKER